ncbi:hypothetical protein ABEW68_27240 [Paenibacillus lautus]
MRLRRSMDRMNLTVNQDPSKYIMRFCAAEKKAVNGQDIGAAAGMS